MNTEVSLPPLGESAREATVSRWMKAIGDTTVAGEPLLEVSTDKVDTEIPAPVSGTLLEIRFNEDDVVKVGEVLAVIGRTDNAGVADWATRLEPGARFEDGESGPAGDTGTRFFEGPAADASRAEEQPERAADEPERAADETADDEPGRPEEPERAADEPEQPAPPPQPAAPDGAPGETAPDEPGRPEEPERAADAGQTEEPPEQPAPPPQPAAPDGLDSDDGYVTPQVRKLADELGVDLSTVQGTGVGGRVRKQDLLDAVQQPDEPAPEPPPPAPAPEPVAPDPRRGTTVPLSPIQSARAEMATSAKLMLTAGVEVDVTNLAPDARRGHILAAVAATLRHIGDLNASLLGDTVAYHDRENLCWTVTTPVGSLTPVVHDAIDLSPEQLEAAIADLTYRGARGELNPSDLADGTFTVRDDAALAWATPSINRPQVGALSIGRIAPKAVVAVTGGNRVVEVRDMVALTLSYDRRAVDPSVAAAFLAAVQSALQSS